MFLKCQIMSNWYSIFSMCSCILYFYSLDYILGRTAWNLSFASGSYPSL